MRINSFRKILVLVSIMVLFSFSGEVLAQCPMCRSAVESAMQQEGNTVGRGLNKGILYLLATPYLFVAIIGGIWYKNNRKGKI